MDLNFHFIHRVRSQAKTLANRTALRYFKDNNWLSISWSELQQQIDQISLALLANHIDIQDNTEHDKSSAGHSVEVKKNIVVSVEPSLSLKDTQEDLIRKALEKHDGNRKKAAEELGISERTLYRRIPDDYKTKR